MYGESFTPTWWTRSIRTGRSLQRDPRNHQETTSSTPLGIRRRRLPGEPARSSVSGSVYHGFARSPASVLGHRPAYTFLGSLVWEIAGRPRPLHQRPGHDGIGGSLLGEPLFRLSSLILEDGGDHPDSGASCGAAVVSPPTGFNRLAFGDRFKGVFPSHSPATLSRVRLGVTLNDNRPTAALHDNFSRNEGPWTTTSPTGFPGKTGTPMIVRSTTSTSNSPPFPART